MVALLCEMCGGNLTTDAGNGYIICESCDVRYDTSATKQKKESGIKIGSISSGYGTNSASDKLFEDAEMFIKLEKQTEANNIFSRLSNEHPTDYRGWWGLAKFAMDSNYVTHRKSALENMRNAIIAAHGSTKEELKQHLRNYANRCSIYDTTVVIKSFDNRFQSLESEQIDYTNNAQENFQETKDAYNIEFRGVKTARITATVIGILLFMPFLGNIFAYAWYAFFTFAVIPGGIGAFILLLAAINVESKIGKRKREELRYRLSSAQQVLSDASIMFERKINDLTQEKANVMRENEDFQNKINEMLKL